jgi:uncharacterized protein YjbI with pentapeptide repeats
MPEAVARTLVLRGRSLRGAVFTASDLRKADLTGAILVGARLDRAWLQGASLDGAQMQGASLNGAQMQGASLDRAQMQGASLNGAQMQGASLRDAQMQSASLDFAQMQGASLDRAQMQGASLDRAQMQGAILDGSSLWRVAGAWADRVLASLEAVSFQSTAPQEERPEERRKPMTWPAWGHRWVNTVPNESAGRTAAAAGGLARRARHTTATGNAAALSGRRGARRLSRSGCRCP